MRHLGRALLMFLLLPPLAAAVWFGWEFWRDLSGGGAGRFAGAERQIVFPLDDDQATRFVFSAPQRSVRIVTHAELAAPATRNLDQRYRYAIVIETLARGGEVIDRRRLEFATRVLLAPGPDGALAPASAYAEADLIPSAADVTLIDLPRAAKALRIRSAGRQAGVSGVAARVYERMPISERQLRTAWSRLSATEKKELTRGSAVPADLLSEAERRALLKNRWSPVGPQGADYRVRTLYVRDVPAVLPGQASAATPDAPAPPTGARMGVSWLAGPGAPLVFPVSHVGDSATPFRLTLRSKRRSGASVRYELLNEGGAVAAAGSLLLRDAPSDDRQGTTPLGAPSVFWFNLPPRIRAIRIIASIPVAVSAANRPPDLAPVVLVPERQVEGNTGPTWFPVDPAAGAKSVALVLGPGKSSVSDPPEGGRGWQRLEPVGRPLLREIYVPVGTDPNPDNVFTPLASGIGTLSFVAPNGSAAVRPRLLYLRDQPGLLELSGTIDGEAWFSERVASISGTLPLDPVTPGRHAVTIAPALGARLYVTYLPPGRDSLRERRFVQLRPGETRFAVEKKSAGAELVVVHLLLPPGDRRALSLSIDGAATEIGPHDGWTPRRRRFSVAPGAADRRIHAVGDPDALGVERRLLVPLRADLPPGRYRITITLGRGSVGYGLLTHRTPGTKERRDIVLEEEIGF